MRAHNKADARVRTGHAALPHFVALGLTPARHRSELKKLIELHAVEQEAHRMKVDPDASPAVAASLKQMEISIIHGALDLWSKKVAEIMVPWNEVYKIPSKYALAASAPAHRPRLRWCCVRLRVPGSCSQLSPCLRLASARLDINTMANMLRAGFSRVPVYVLPLCVSGS